MANRGRNDIVRRKSTSLLLLVVAISLAAVACTGNDKQDTSDSAGGSGSATSTPAPGDLSLDDVQLAAEIAGLDSSRYDRAERSDSGVGISLLGPKKLEVGDSGIVYVRITNDSANYKPEKPFDISQTKGHVFTGGPISVESIQPTSIQEALALKPDDEKAGKITVSCTDEGSVSVTFNSKGTSEAESPATSYTTTVDYHFECVSNDEDPLT